MKKKEALMRVILMVPLMLVFVTCTNDSEKVTIPVQPGGQPTTLKAKIAAAADSIRLAVQRFRGKNYKRPVFVSVFTQSQYAAQVGNQFDTIPQSTKNLYNNILRLEGLLRPGADYYSSYDSTIASGTDGFYVPGTDSLYVILADTATGLAFEDSLTLFHEFVHALQDQYFGLDTINNPYAPSDMYYAADYVIEGEAELLMDYYYFFLNSGAYPTTSTPVVNFLNQEQIGADADLDSMHQHGEPMLTNMPLQWEYFSYGPRFINAIAGMTWSIIDNTIFPALPLRMLEVLHPQKYSAANEYILNTQGLDSVIVQSNLIEDDDQLGELLADVMFREWDFSAFRDIPNGMTADESFVFQDLQTDTLRMVWYTYWKDSSAAATFFANYASLVNKKRNIVLPPAVDSTGFVYVNDTVNNIYIELATSYVFTIENYKKSALSSLTAACRTVQPASAWGLAKARARTSARFSRIDKHRLLDRGIRRFPPARGPMLAARHFLHPGR
jgi:hypothetical protein